MATTLSLIVIFLPVSFMSSISGRFLYSFGVTAAVAILVSLIVSFSLTPMMSSRMLRHRRTADTQSRAADSTARIENIVHAHARLVHEPSRGRGRLAPLS